LQESEENGSNGSAGLSVPASEHLVAALPAATTAALGAAAAVPPSFHAPPRLLRASVEAAAPVSPMMHSAVAGRPVEIHLNALDGAEAALSAQLTDPFGELLPVSIGYNAVRGGSIIRFVSTVAGIHTLRLGGLSATQLIQKERLHRIDVAADNLHAPSCSAAGIATHVARAGVWEAFNVVARDKYDNVISPPPSTAAAFSEVEVVADGKHVPFFAFLQQRTKTIPCLIRYCGRGVYQLR
jgi:hypothetical protein